MQITVYSVLMAIIWLSLLSILIYFLLKIDKFIYSFSVWSILILLAASIIRMIGIIEFPGAKVIHEYNMMPAVSDFLYLKPFSIFNMQVTVLSMLLTAWGLGSAFLAVRLVVKYLNFCKRISRISSTDDECIIKIVKEVCPSIKHIRLIKCKSVDVPVTFGYFKPTILLPDICMTEKEIRYILLHEVNHYIHRDLWIKLIVNVTCIIWWWNPLVYFLKRNIDHTLEMKCDMYATADMLKDERIEYFDTILNVCRNTVSRRQGKSYTTAFTAGLVSARNNKQLIQRFKVGLEYHPNKYCTLVNAVICVALICTLILSYAFIIQPAGFPEDKPEMYDSSVDGKIFITTSESSYLIDNGDGTYAFYSNGEYINNITDIYTEPFSNLEIKDGNTE